MLIPGADSTLYNSTAGLVGELAKANVEASHWLAVVNSKDIANNLKIEAKKTADDIQQALDSVTKFLNTITSG